MRTWLGLVLAMLVTSCAVGGTAPAGLNGQGAPPDPGASAAPGPPAPLGASGAAASPELALAKNLPAQCTGPEIVRIDRPIAASDPTKGHFSYGFRFKAPTAAGAPVLVFLPGGPGMTSTDQVPTFLPSGWGYLLTDPRGVGCNTLAAVPSDDVASVFWRSEELAADAVAAIADRRLDGYVLFGLSYGTVLAAMAAPALEAQGIAPRAVVLEGVVGRALAPSEYAGAEAIAQWNKVRAALPSDVRAELDTQASPFGIAPDGWSHALTTLLAAGPAVVGPMIGGLPLTGDTVQSFANAPLLEDPMSVALYRFIACREIDDSAPVADLDPMFSQGLLVRNTAQEGTKCAGLHVTDPYDSAKYPFTTKAYFFAGDSDIDTPLWQGAYAFDHHPGHVVRVVAQDAGHLSLELDQGACAPALLTSIAGGGADLKSVLATCPCPATVAEK